MSARLDAMIATIVKFNADGMILSSGGNVTLVFAGAERFANHSTPHAELVAMIDEAAPPSARDALRAGTRARFTRDHGGKTYTIRVDPKGPTTWRIVLEPPTAGAAKPAAPAPPAASPPPAAASKDPAPAAAPVTPYRSPAPPKEKPPSVEAPAPPISPIEAMLIEMKRQGASDLHVSSNNTPKIRVHGDIRPLGPPHDALVDADALMALLRPIVPEKNLREFEERNDTDFAHAIPGVSRFRANLFRDRHGPAAVFRAIPFTILTPEQLGLSKHVLELCFLSKGLVLVTGPTGSGKSTTLATLIDHINRHRQDHIITIEDPIEFVHENKSCLVNQREVHTHTRSFKDALRAALREDPDIVLVGEMRDLETIAIAVETAETGHLVFGTLHTSTAPSTIDRIIDQFSADRQEQIRQMLAESLRGVIAQTLCRKVGGGRVAAYEILLGTSAVTNLIRERKTFQLFSVMQTGRAHGMVTLNDSLLELLRKGLIEPREAYMKSVNKTELKSIFQREGIKLDLDSTA